LAVLRNAGIDPLVIVSSVDEDAALAARYGHAPAEIVSALAQMKADDVVVRLPADTAADCVVIGCDSMLLLDGRLSGKPYTPEAARGQWKSMGGRSGQLLTGHCVVRLRHGNIEHREVETASTTIHFARPSDTDLEAYLNTGEPLGVAGGFTLDGLGGWFVDRIEGDPSNVVGLSLPLTRRLIERTGLSLSRCWAPLRGRPSEELVIEVGRPTRTE
jgi:septum formation protein